MCHLHELHIFFTGIIIYYRLWFSFCVDITDIAVELR